MLREAAAVVIGSGALGCSVAYHLAKSGVAPVTLIDKHEIASQTSPRAAGLSSELRKSELMTRLAVMGVEKIKGFAAETGEEMVMGPVDLILFTVASRRASSSRRRNGQAPRRGS